MLALVASDSNVDEGVIGNSRITYDLAVYEGE